MRRTPLIAVIAALALLAGACGGGGSDKKSTDATKDTTSTSELAVDDSTTTTGVAAGSTTTGKPGATTTTKAGTSATTSKPIAAPTTAAPAGDPVPSAAAPGTYNYSQSGYVTDANGNKQNVPASGTLVVAGGSYKRYFDTNKPPQTLVFDFGAAGPYLKSASLNANGVTVTCSFGSGVPLPPWPPTPGKTFSGSGTCPTPIGTLTASINGSITSRSGDIVGIASTITVTNPSVHATATDTEGWSISLRVPKTSHQVISGTAYGKSLDSDVSSTLTS